MTAPTTVPETTGVGQSTQSEVLVATPSSAGEKNGAPRLRSPRGAKKKVAKKANEEHEHERKRDASELGAEFRLDVEPRRRRVARRPARFCDRMFVCCKSKSTVV